VLLAAFLAFPGHAGRARPLLRWRSSLAWTQWLRRGCVFGVPRPRRPRAAAPSLALRRSRGPSGCAVAAWRSPRPHGHAGPSRWRCDASME